MKALFLSILFLFFNTINPFAQVRKIIFPEYKHISHEDSMGIILIDHIYNGRREKAVEMLKSGKVGGNVRDINGYYAIQYAFEYSDTNLVTLLIEKGAQLENKNGGNNLWFDTNNRHFNHYNFLEIIEGGICGCCVGEKEI
ncbi:MAG: ankyrin repeat domain-containing protein, partial [Cytophagales bacterium]|nr:ankyrin repeat domain-containing protein [Cytophagales bacterium]